MFLCLDVGNTGVSWGLFDGRKMRGGGNCRNDDEIASLISGLPHTLDGVIAATVAPARAGQIFSSIEKEINLKPQLAGKDFPIPIENLTLAADQVGHDRLLGAIGAFMRTKKATIVTDAGTAITINYIDAKCRFRGGVIMPGATTGGRALHRYTEILPRVQVEKPREMIGRDTEEAIRSGLYWGAVGAVEGIIDRFRRSAGDAEVIFTGGDGSWIAAELGKADSYVPYLTLEGLYIAYEQARHMP
jgi:type III pantothenate kinase